MMEERSPFKWWWALHEANVARIDAVRDLNLARIDGDSALAKRCIDLEYRVSMLELWLRVLATCLVGLLLLLGALTLTVLSR